MENVRVLLSSCRWSQKIVFYLLENPFNDNKAPRVLMIFIYSSYIYIRYIYIYIYIHIYIDIWYQSEGLLLRDMLSLGAWRMGLG